MRISNRPAFYDARTPERKTRRGDVYDEEYREQDEESRGRGDASAGDDEDVEGRYHQLYEQRMNPFDQVCC